MAVKRKYKFLMNPATGKRVRVFEGDDPPWESLKQPLPPGVEEAESTTTPGTEPDLSDMVKPPPAREPTPNTYRRPQPITAEPPLTQVHCFHHNDLDGRSAGAVVRMAMPWAIMHEIDYNYDPNMIYQTPPNSLMVFVDFTPKLEHFSEIARKGAREFIWIDHHQSAVDLVQGEGFAQVPGLRTSEHSGAYLTWNYFYPQLPIPRALTIISRWDTWTHNDDPEVLAFKAGIEGYDQAPESPIWVELLASERAEQAGRRICQEGGYIMESKKSYWKECMDLYSFPVRFRHQRFSRYSGIALNLPIAPSLAFGDAQADLLVMLAYNGSQWKVSLYSHNSSIKCDEIARHYGGGGHPGAAGFFATELHMFTTDEWDGQGSPAATAPMTAGIRG